MVAGKLLAKMLQVKGMAHMLQFVETDKKNIPEPYLEALQELLNEFKEVTDTPQGLPLSRECDHSIPLVDPRVIVSAHSYR